MDKYDIESAIRVAELRWPGRRRPDTTYGVWVDLTPVFAVRLTDRLNSGGPSRPCAASLVARGNNGAFVAILRAELRPEVTGWWTGQPVATDAEWSAAIDRLLVLAGLTGAALLREVVPRG